MAASAPRKTCGDRYRDAVNTYDCPRPFGHDGAHAAGEGDQVVTWKSTPAPMDPVHILGAEAAPSAASTQAAQGRADSIEHLIFRAACGVLKAEEGALLRTLLEQDRDDIAGRLAVATANARASADAAWKRVAWLGEVGDRQALRLRKARQERNDARERIATYERGTTEQRAAHEERRLSLSDALGLGTSAPWSTIIEQARETRVHGQVGPLLAAGNLNYAWQRVKAAEADAAELRREQHNLRRELADILNAGRETAWSALLGTVAARHADWARCRDEAERHAAANVAAARQAEAEAVRARQAAEQREQKTADALRETERQLGEARQRADLAAFTAPTSPRDTTKPVPGNHPVNKLYRALTSRMVVTGADATDLIAQYYQAVTSAPTADPAEQTSAEDAVRGVQGWMALDLHTALGRTTDHHVTAAHQGHGSWADWWSDLLAEVRTRRGRGLGEPYLAVTVNGTLSREQVAEAVRSMDRIPGRGGW